MDQILQSHVTCPAGKVSNNTMQGCPFKFSPMRCIHPQVISDFSHATMNELCSSVSVTKGKASVYLWLCHLFILLIKTGIHMSLILRLSSLDLLLVGVNCPGSKQQLMMTIHLFCFGKGCRQKQLPSLSFVSNICSSLCDLAALSLNYQSLFSLDCTGLHINYSVYVMVLILSNQNGPSGTIETSSTLKSNRETKQPINNGKFSSIIQILKTVFKWF